MYMCMHMHMHMCMHMHMHMHVRLTRDDGGPLQGVCWLPLELLSQCFAHL